MRAIIAALESSQRTDPPLAQAALHHLETFERGNHELAD